MVLLQSPSQLDKYIIDYLEEYLNVMVYCVDYKLYTILKDRNIPVDIAYLSDGLIYLCDGTLYKGEIVVDKIVNLHKQFLKYNTSLISDEESYEVFNHTYKEISEQDILISEVN